MKWEKAGDEPTNMAWGTEFLLRCRALTKVAIDREELGVLAAALTRPPEGVAPALRIARAWSEMHEPMPLPSMQDIPDEDSDPCHYTDAHQYGECQLEGEAHVFADAA
jgi:hypothetical protein